MNKIMSSMMLSCDKATILIEKKNDGELDLRERFLLKFHTSMCDACTNYQQHSELVHKALRKNINSETSPGYSVLPHLKASILKQLNIR